MGVRGLRAYMTRKIIKPPIREKIYIKKEIQEWTRAKKTRPKILIDLKDIVHMAVQARQMQNTIGGQYLLYINFYRNLFTKFEDAGADLVFFAAGNKLSDELEIFIPKREEDYMAYLSILDDIDANEGRWSKSVEPKCKKRAPLATEFNMLKLAQQHGKLHINYIRHNQEIVKYANANVADVLALISNDTEFLIFDGDYQVWRATDLIPSDLTAFRFCRKTLRDHLELNTPQLELLSALSDTNYLPGEILTDFYAKIGVESSNGGHIYPLAKYIRDEVPLLPTSRENAFRFDLEKIAQDIFGENYSRDDLNAIENGLIQYNLNFKTNGSYPYKRPSLDFCKTCNMFIFKLFTDKVYLVKDIRYIDYRNFKSKNYAELIIPLLRKLQGILYANEPRRPKTRAICMKYAHDEPYKVVDEPIVYPSAKIPDLFDFVFKTRNTDYKLDGLRWSLFDWLFEFGSDFENALRTLNKKYTAAVVTIKYLLTQGEINTVEADAFLITENLTRKMYFVRSSDPELLNAHFIRLAHLYTKMYRLVNHCLETCGLYSYTAMIMFDGPCFHNTLNSLVNKKDSMESALREVQPFRIYVN